jgi:chemotaxis protein methyltransferase CheR
MLLHQLSFSALVNKILNNNSFFLTFLEEITVNVTEFFRDPNFYNYLRNNIIPQLQSYPVIRIWHAGCATGEEAYSMAILLKEADLLSKSIIYATDISQKVLLTAANGKYPIEIFDRMNANYLLSGGNSNCKSFCKLQNNEVIFNDELKERILFSHHNLVTDQSFNEFNLIFCRNVLIYFNSNLQNTVLQLLTKSLATFGYLALGSKESLEFTCSAKYFETINKKEKIYRKKKDI